MLSSIALGSPSNAAESGVAGRITSIEGTYCDFGVRKFDVEIKNTGSERVFMGLYDRDEVRISAAVRLQPGEVRVLEAGTRDDALFLYALEGDRSTLPDERLDRVETPPDPDCSAWGPAARIGGLDPRTCTWSASLDNTASSGPVLYSLGSREDVIVPGRSTDRARARVVLRSPIPLDPSGHVSSGIVWVSETTLLESKEFAVGPCERPALATGAAGLLAPLGPTPEVSARTVVPGRVSCDGLDKAVRVEIGLVSPDERGTAVLRASCESLAGTYTLSVHTEESEQGDSMEVDEDDVVELVVTGSAVLARNLTTGESVRVAAALSGATYAWVVQATRLDAVEAFELTDVSIGGERLSEAPTTFFHSIRSPGVESIPLRVTKVDAVDDSFAFVPRPR